MNSRTALALWLLFLMRIALLSTPAADRLPDEAAVRDFVKSPDFTLQGWWQKVEPPSRRSPGEFLYLEWNEGPQVAFELHLVSGRILFGKGTITEVEAAAIGGASGELESAMLRVATEDLSDLVKLQLTPAGTWSVDFFGLKGTPATQTAKDFDEALTLCRRHSEMTGKAVANMLTYAGELDGAVPLPETIAAVPVELSGGKVDAWRAEFAGRTVFLAKKDARVLEWEASGNRYRPAGEADVEALRQRMAAKEGPPLNLAEVESARIVFEETEVSHFAPSQGQAVKAVGKGVEVSTGTDDPAPKEAEELGSWAKPDAAVTRNGTFQEIARAVNSVGTDSLEVARVAADVLMRGQILERDFEAVPVTALACLEAGKGHIVSLTRVVVECCRHQGMAAREVHGFIVHPDCEPVMVSRHCWLEVLDEGAWTVLDPWMPAMFDGAEEEWTARYVSGLHVRVCHGTPSVARERFLESSPAVNVAAANGTTGESIDWPEAELRRIIRESQRNLFRVNERKADQTEED